MGLLWAAAWAAVGALRGDPERMDSKLLAVVPVLLLAACSAGGDVESRTYVARDSAGVRIIESVLPEWPAPRAIEAEPLLRIGREEEGPYQLAFVARALLIEDGSIVVAEASAQEVRIFDSDGRHVTTLGRRGEGPGEFSGIGDVFAYSDDSLAVYDGRLRRTTIFDRESGAYRTVANQIEGNYAVFGRAGDGPLLLYSPGSGYRPDLPAGLQWVLTDIVAVDPFDGSYRVIAQLPQREQFVEPGGDTRPVIPGRYAIHAAADGGFYWGTPDRYEIGFFDVEGVKRRALRRPIEPRRVQQDDIDAYVEAQLDRVRRFEGEAALPRYRRSYEEASYGELVPLFGVAFVDRNQRLWVSGPVWPDVQGPPLEWTVFSEEGMWLGDLRAPDQLMVFDSRGDLVLGVWTDELGVPHVQLHRIVEG